MDGKRSDDNVWSKVVMNNFQYIGSTLIEDITSDADTGPQEGVCNWCGQLGGRRVGNGVIIITCADPVPGKKSITDIGGYVLGLFWAVHTKLFSAAIWHPSCIVFVAKLSNHERYHDDSYQNPCTKNNSHNIISEDAIHGHCLRLITCITGIVVYCMKVVRRPLLTYVVFWCSWQPGIELQLQKATFFADTHTQAVSILE